MARHGKLALFRSFGRARVEPDAPADARSLFLLYSNTKVLTTAALWMLAEDGLLRFSDTVAMHFPGFEAHGKDARFYQCSWLTEDDSSILMERLTSRMDIEMIRQPKAIPRRVA